MYVSQKHLQASLLESLLKHRIPGASAAILHQGQVIMAAAGVVNVTTGVEMTADTLLHIHSITKLFNATLVMQMVDEGRVKLDDFVAPYVPDLVLKDRRALGRITVRMLLNHTSGIDGDMLPDHGHDEETIEKGISRFSSLGQLFPPGTECSYSNAATVIAGYLVQRLTNCAWHRLIRERLFEPLGMVCAATLPEEALLQRSSIGHFHSGITQKGDDRVSRAFLPLSFAPAGTT